MASPINIENSKHFLQTDYSHFLQNILTKIQLARYDMLQSVSRQTVLLYWEIGRTVSEKMQLDGWGKSVVEQLSKDIQTEFPDVRGFSARNIWNMKKFYEFYNAALQSIEKYTDKNSVTAVALNSVVETQIVENSAAMAALKSATTVANLQNFLFQLITDVGWTQNCIILEKCKDLNQIVFYLKMTKAKGWSKLDLREKIEKNYFENHALAQNNFEETTPKILKAQVAWEFLDDYNIELLNPDQPIAEKTLENAIVDNIVKFLHEMGGNFAFVGRQFRLELDEKEYFVDLLFFNITLNCYVVFELKAREFSPKDFGQTQMYMQLINKQVKQAYHNPTIGVIVCRSKNRLEVEYMLEQAKDPMGVATYNRYDKLPDEYDKYLPSEEEITKRLSALINIDDE
jgi:predicted nuclease of restriction endonuclease-like (RecB) superfamily